MVFSEATVQNIQDADKKNSSSSPSAINHLFVSATKRKTLRGKALSSTSTASSSESVEKPIEKEQNAYEKESTAHLNTLFKGNQNKSHNAKPTSKTNTYETSQSTVKPKLEHVGLNGEICKLEVPEKQANGHKPVSLHTASSKSNNEGSFLGSNQTQSNVEVLSKNSPAVFDTKSPSEQRNSFEYSRSSARKSFEGPKEQSSSTDNPFLKSWMLQEDQRCKYPANFNPFPQRNKAPARSRILYGNISNKGGRRKEAFQSRKSPRPPAKGNSIPEELKS